MWRFNWNGLSDTNRIKAFAELAMVEFHEEKGTNILQKSFYWIKLFFNDYYPIITPVKLNYLTAYNLWEYGVQL
jgi:hypothetical protein